MFEGYIGIQLWSEQMMVDLMVTILLSLFVLFAISARVHVKSFFKMFRCVSSLSRRGLNTEISVYYNRYFYSFMTIQTLLLVSVSLFLEAFYQGYTYRQEPHKLYIALISTFGLILFYYGIRRMIYNLLLYVFTDLDYYRHWKLNYNSIIGLWGMTLYAPVILQAFVGESHTIAITLLIILYIFSRFAIIYKSIRLFYTKKFDLFYLSLYLCGHEILPLWILYKGLILLYNIIEKSAIWH